MPLNQIKPNKSTLLLIQFEEINAPLHHDSGLLENCTLKYVCQGHTCGKAVRPLFVICNEGLYGDKSKKETKQTSYYFGVFAIGV